jgi:cyclophilin family peptidyl-prolyl cis-trans isomerase/HEAT repeat protein
MMRLTQPARIGVVLALLAAGCPKATPTTTPASAPPPSDPRIGKLARILRTSDRRIVDDDLRALLADGDVAVRTKAILALGQIGDPSTVPDLEKAAADPALEARAASAFAMGLIAEAATQNVLKTLAGDTAPSVRSAAAEALGRIHDASGADAVRALLDDPEGSVRAAAALAAWKFPEGDPFLAPLIKNLASQDAEVRAAAAYALARLASAAIAPASSGAPVGRLSEAGVAKSRVALIERVTDANSEVRMQVARGLASPKSGGAELAAVGTLTNDRDAGVRVNAVRALGYPGIAIKPYLDRAVSDKDQHVARAAIESVGKIGGAPAEEALNELLPRLEKGWLQEAALTALAKIDPALLPNVVRGLLVNPDPVMRVAACGLLAGRKEPEAIAAATRLLDDPEPRVQAAAVPVVAEHEGAISKLLAAQFASKDPVVRAAAAEAVGGRFASKEAVVDSRDELFRLLEEVWSASSADTLSDAKIAMVDAIAKAGKDDRTASALNRALRDPDVVVRRRAAVRSMDVYHEDRSREVGPAIDRPLADYERIVRWALVPHAALVQMRRPGTAVGAFTLALDASLAPLAAWNFSELAGKKFFDGATLHRVVPNFVVQDGDPRGDGYGGPGYSIRDEFNPLPFTAGVLGMASDGKDTAGSQWFIMLSAAPHLDGRYTSFGHVVRGFRDMASQMRPGDTVVAIRVYEGDGTQLPATMN